MPSPSLRYNSFTGLEWSFQMLDLGFNELGELIEEDEETAAESENTIESDTAV